MDEKKISHKERELVIARLQIISGDLYFSDGDNGNAYSRDDMIGLIEKGDKVGLEFVRTELEFLRALKSGDIMRRVTNFKK